MTTQIASNQSSRNAVASYDMAISYLAIFSQLKSDCDAVKSKINLHNLYNLLPSICFWPKSQLIIYFFVQGLAWILPKSWSFSPKVDQKSAKHLFSQPLANLPEMPSLAIWPYFSHKSWILMIQIGKWVYSTI